MKYDIVYGYSTINMGNALIAMKEKVREAIKAGWKPEGGLSMSDYRGYYYAAQSIVKEKE